MEQIVREARAADCGQLTEIVRSSQAYGGEYGMIVATLTVDPQYVEQNLTRVVESDGQPAGFYSLLVPGLGADGEGEIDYFFVADGLQGKGLGRVLAEDLLIQAKRLGLRGVHIVSHPPAEGFYGALGAIRIGTLPPKGAVTWSRPHLYLTFSTEDAS